MDNAKDKKPLIDHSEKVQFCDLFELEKIQHLQDIFAETHGVASIITDSDGAPITKPSKFTRLCNDIIRNTPKGCENCFKSDASVGRKNSTGPIIQPCLSGGLWDAGVSITVGGLHVANWLIGQVCNEQLDLNKIMTYADEIGANRDEFQKALAEVPVMSFEQFEKVANMLFVFVNELSDKAFVNLQLNKQIQEGLAAAETLRQLEDKYRLMFENSPQPMLIASSNNLAIVEVNQAMIDHYGYSRDEFKKMTFKDIHCTNNDSLLLNNAEKSKGLFYSTKEAIHTKKNGKKINVEVSFDNLVYEKNNALLVYINDITEQKRTEETLAKEQFLLSLVMKNLPQNIYFKDRDSRFIRISNAHTRFFRLNDPTEAVGKTDFDFFTLEHAQKAFDDEQRIIETGKPIYNLEEKETHPDGRITWVSTTKLPMRDKSGAIIGTMGISADITERKKYEEDIYESEKKLRTLFSAMTEMVALHDLVFDENNAVINYRITDCNEKYTKVVGLKKENVIGRLATEVYQTETPPYIEDFIKVAITGEPYEYTTYFAPMDKHFMVSVVSPRKNSFATITTDISELKQFQEEITAKKNELENYLYIASHDLRSPMVNIQGFSQRLQKQSLAVREALATCQIQNDTKTGIERIINEDIPKSLNFILTNINKMDMLINGLLQLSRTGRVKMDIKKIDMNRLMQSIVSAFNFQLNEIGADVIVDDLPFIYGDENQLNQLFSNIIGNAIRYRNVGHNASIHISGKSKYNKAVFSIKDNGIGIAQKYLDRIWDVFFRANPSDGEPGEGLGLSLAKRIVDKNRGKIWVESTEGQGSTFYIELNRKEFSE